MSARGEELRVSPGNHVERIRALVAARRPGHGLPGPFQWDEAVHQEDMNRIWRRGWLFAGLSCEVREPGDWLRFDVDTESVVLIRGDDGVVRGFHNVCRHRGTQVCLEDAGHATSLVCPYHQWTYARDGSLLTCRGMHDVDKAALGLSPVHVRDAEGLLFVSLADNPPDFTAAFELMAPMARVQKLADAKVAKHIDYEIDANWKVVWENNRECFHCNVNHPEYIKANYDHYDGAEASGAIGASVAEAIQRSREKWGDSPLAATHPDSGLTHFPDPERGIWFSANRTILVPGFVTESLDGQQVAPLMGAFADPDVGVARIRTLPNFWCHASCDHAFTTRLAPAGPRRTRARASWFVHRDAEEGKDYELEALLPFWQCTSEQDWELCRRVQRGVESSGYIPGPFSTEKEFNVDAFVRWYLGELTRA